ncbi:MAG: APC family permease [Fusobacteriaceae bacterium]
MKKKITFVQALCTAMGNVIGSGIFFRASRILNSTQGNSATAVLGWIVLGATIIFAGFATAVLAKRSTKPGGMVGYIEEQFGKKAAFAVGWFMAVIYIPSLCGILGIVAVDFMTQLFGINVSVQAKYAMVALTIIAVYGWNIASTKIGALFSTFATYVKVMPLIAIAILGIVLGKGDSTMMVKGAENLGSALVIKDAATNMFVTAENPQLVGFALFTAPLLSMAFAFDGWFNIGAMRDEMENPEVNLPKVFAWNAVLVTLVYGSYFAAVTLLMDPAEIMNAGNGHVGMIANKFFGANGEKLVLTAVVISVLGTLNANAMAGMRYVQALANDDEFPFANFFKQINPTTHTPINGAWFAMGGTAVLYVLYYLQEASGMFKGISFDDVPIMFVSLFLLLVILASHMVAKKENLGFFTTYVVPVIAAIGQIFIVVSFFVTNSNAVLYTIISLAIIGSGYVVKNLGNCKKA